MATAIICSALLGLLVFGLGFLVSLTRGQTSTNFGMREDPKDRLYRMVRAHGNATEYAPMLAVLMLLVGAQGAAPWMNWTMMAAAASRYLHVAGMLTGPPLDAVNPLRFVGALGTYLTGLALVVAAFLAA